MPELPPDNTPGHDRITRSKHPDSPSQVSLADLLQPIDVGWHTSALPKHDKSAVQATLRAACDTLKEVERHISEGRDRVADLEADKALGTLKQAGCLDNSKVGAICRYAKGVICINLGKPQVAAEVLERAISTLGNMRRDNHADVVALEVAPRDKSVWTLDPGLGVSKYDIWLVGSALLRAHASSGRTERKCFQRALNIAEELLAQMKPEVEGNARVHPALCAMYADVASSYAELLVSPQKSPSKKVLIQVAELRSQTFELLKKSAHRVFEWVKIKKLELREHTRKDFKSEIFLVS